MNARSFARSLVSGFRPFASGALLGVVFLASTGLGACGNTSFKENKSSPVVKAKRLDGGTTGVASAAEAVRASEAEAAGTEAGGAPGAEAAGGAKPQLKPGSGSDLPSAAEAGAAPAAGSAAAPPANAARQASLGKAASQCLAKLGLPPDSALEHVLVRGGNHNNRSLFQESAARAVPALVEIDVKNANKASLGLQAPKGQYCLMLEAKNANGIDINVACDAKVVVMAISYKAGSEVVVQGQSLLGCE